MARTTISLAKVRIVTFVLLLPFWYGLLGGFAFCGQTERPNILWITSEDNGIELGCYGDKYATSPNIDALATQGIRFNHCWSNAPVCAPARTTIISGVYATSLGASNMRSRAKRPEGTLLLPELLRDHGYYCSNNSKEDYNFRGSSKPWDDSSTKAHWRNRPDGKPFFSVFNFTTSHESQIRKRPHVAKHDPAKVTVPPYHPDLPEVRRDWAQYYDKIEEMDAQVGSILEQLRADGLLESTIIFYFGDHGSGMPRSKRWLYQSGLQVPMVVVIPEQFKHLRPEGFVPGGVDTRLVAFVDLVSTVLKLADAPIPEYLQGIPFLGAGEQDANEFLFGFRDRMDERIDMSRAVRSKRFLYIRNFMPYRSQGTFLNYMFQTPTTVAWRQAYRDGLLAPHQEAFWKSKPIEELYDLQEDPFQIRNIAQEERFLQIKTEHKDRLMQIMVATTDLGLIPESIVKADRIKPDWDWQEMVHAAFYASKGWPTAELVEHRNPVVRYWAAQHLLTTVSISEQVEPEKFLEIAMQLRGDSEVSVRIIALEAIAKAGNQIQKSDAISELKSISNLHSNGLLNAVAAMNSLANLEAEFENVNSLPSKDPSMEPVYHDYIERLKDYLSHKEH